MRRPLIRASYFKNPASLLKMTPRAWSLLTKDCGDCKVIEPAPASLIVRFTELPVALRARSMLYLLAGGCDACVEEAGFQGTSTMHDDKLAFGRAEVLVSFHAAR